MSFHFVDDQLYAENRPLAEIAARYGTPLYVYSRGRIVECFNAYRDAFAGREHDICYAVKANGNLSILKLLHELGAGFDVVSMGELARVEAAGGELARTVFAGVGKTRSELEYAVSRSIGCINVESADEMHRIDEIASSLGRRARIAVRVNPDVDPNTHPYISTGLNENKFGIPMADAVEMYRTARGLSGIDPVGVACHIGSQLTETAPFVAAAERVRQLLSTLEAEGIELDHVDIGGGLGIAYDGQKPPAVGDYIRAVSELIDRKYRLVVEPGRSLVGDAGVLLTEVLYVKSTPVKTFAIVDASMTELIRPALYQANHRIENVRRASTGVSRQVDVVGPVCETADFLARDVELDAQVGDILAIRDTGAYGAVMASTYNGRPRPAEVLVNDAELKLIRQRETIDSLFADEQGAALQG